MKVLFVSRSNYSMGISPIITVQGDSLTKQGAQTDYCKIKSKGIKGYLYHIIPLRKLLKQNSYEIIHTHYSLSAFVVSLTFTKVPIVV